MTAAPLAEVRRMSGTATPWKSISDACERGDC